MSDYATDKNGNSVHKDGWGIRFSGMECCTYFEKDHEVSFEFHYRQPRKPNTFDAMTPRQWDAPHAGEPLSEAQWAQIIERLTDFLTTHPKYGPFAIGE